jgi:hypothetical protein
MSSVSTQGRIKCLCSSIASDILVRYNVVQATAYLYPAPQTDELLLLISSVGAHLSLAMYAAR